MKDIVTRRNFLAAAGVVAVAATSTSALAAEGGGGKTLKILDGMIPVGGHAPAFQGATLLSANDSITQDDLGLKTAAQLGKHVGEVAVKLAVGAA